MSVFFIKNTLYDYILGEKLSKKELENNNRMKKMRLKIKELTTKNEDKE